MKSGYEILWTENALNELQKTINYLKENWTEKEIQKLALAVEKTILLLTKKPLLFPESDIKKTFEGLLFWLIIRCITESLNRELKFSLFF
jgi:hypothetical protein